MPDDSQPTASRLLRGDAVFSDPLVRELLDARLIGVLATTQRDGAIHAVPMWFARHEDAVVLATSSESRKLANLELDDRATLVVHDSRPGTEVCGVSIRGRIEVVRATDADELVQLVHLRYVTAAGLALPETRTFLAGDDVALRLTPGSSFTWDERGNPATRALRETGGALPLVPTSPR
jgi:PPOX class probable F420-dependent enzyme